MSETEGREGKSREEDCLAGAECVFMFGCFAIGCRVKGYKEKSRRRRGALIWMKFSVSCHNVWTLTYHRLR